jgi:Phosphoserine phosphatase RsbU, N-terminal domain
MSEEQRLFSRRYRTALLEYLLGSGETGLSTAYDLGRSAIDQDLGLLPILRAHQNAVSAVLDTVPDDGDAATRLRAAEEFLIETLSPFEMTYRGYLALLEEEHGRRPRQDSGGATSTLFPVRTG